MPSQIKPLNGDGTKNPNLFRKANPVTTTTKTKVSSGMSGGSGGNPNGKKTNPSTMNKRAIPYKMGTTHHAPGTVPEYLRGKK